MDVCPGDIIHLDENGAVKFPREYLEEVLKRVKRFSAIEARRQELLAKAQNGAEVDKIMSGMYD